jgi:hypothetical protein
MLITQAEFQAREIISGRGAEIEDSGAIALPG